MYFQIVCTTDEESHIREMPSGREPIDPLNIGYTDWIAAGNTPAKVAGNKYVSIASDGTVTYDSTTAAVDATAAVWAQVRAQRDGRIAAITWRAERYERQTAAGIPTNDTSAQYQAVLTYIQALRDITTQTDPTAITWPEVPA